MVLKFDGLNFRVLLRMAAVVLLLLILVMQLPNFSVTGSIDWPKSCTANRFTYSSSSDQQLFYINGNEVEKVSFCKSLEYCYETGSFFDSRLEEWGRAKRKYCGLKISLGKYF